MSFDVAPTQDLYTSQGVAVNVEVVPFEGDVRVGVPVRHVEPPGLPGDIRER
jgi:hypothetical protein